MPLLDRDGFKTDRFTRIEGAAIGDAPLALVSWSALPEALQARRSGQGLGVEIPNALAFAQLRPLLPQLILVSIHFPSFADGRGFSLARRIRAAKFAGVLRAHGPLIADQFAYALGCGFDEIELPDDSAGRQPWPVWQAALASISNSYQRGYGDGGNILDQRRAARRREAAHVA